MLTRPSRSPGSPAKASPSKSAGPATNFASSCPDPKFAPPIRSAASTQLSAAAPQADYIVASGSLPLGVPDDFYARVAALAKRHGKRLVLDTSGAALKQAGQGILSAEAEPARTRATRRTRSPRRSRRGSGGPGGDRARPRRDCRFVARCPRRPARQPRRERAVPAIPVEARSTVGAGDSMLAGILVGLTRGLPLRRGCPFRHGGRRGGAVG